MSEAVTDTFRTGLQVLRQVPLAVLAFSLPPTDVLLFPRIQQMHEATTNIGLEQVGIPLRSSPIHNGP